MNNFYYLIKLFCSRVHINYMHVFQFLKMYYISSYKDEHIYQVTEYSPSTTPKTYSINLYIIVYRSIAI
jgi:hypothetical protein